MEKLFHPQGNSIHGRNKTICPIGQRLKAIRARKGMTQDDLCRRSGLSHTTITRLEQGKATPIRRTIDKLMGALEMDLDEFMRGVIVE